MFDYSLPPATGVLPIDVHVVVVPALYTQPNFSPDDVPPPPRI